jgi:hypothetical protein
MNRKSVKLGRRRRLRSARRTKGGCWNWALVRRIGTLAEIRSRFVFYSLPTLDVRELTIMPQKLKSGPLKIINSQNPSYPPVPSSDDKSRPKLAN